MKINLLGTALLIGLLLTTLSTHAQPTHRNHFFTLGGGWAPEGNQVSLEKNILYYQRVLEGLKQNDRPHHTLFADGDSPNRDLQFADPDQPAPDLNFYLAEILGQPGDGWLVNDRYRDSQIPDVDGPATREQLEAYFDLNAAQLTPRDRLVFYFTGHGGGANDKKKAPGNTVMHLWNNQDITVRRFTDQLDKLAPETPVVMVMVQCFSGGFANVIFEGGDPEKGLAAHNRAGFFATVHDRVAAGCTSDIHEANYHEYSTYFFAALYGKTRLGEPAGDADYNDDGRVAFNEAHAYALIESDTIDISVKTSDALLRQFASPTRQHEGEFVSGAVDFARSYFRLLGIAEPHEKAVLKGLSEKLKLKGDDRVSQAQKMLREIGAERRRLGNQNRIKERQYDYIRGLIANVLISRWPELNTPFHPRATQILTREADALLETIESHPRFDDLWELGNEILAVQAERDELERKWVKARRFIHAAQNVALAHNLSKTAAPEVIEKFHALVQAESGSL
jgi:hypothetical protein